MVLPSKGVAREEYDRRVVAELKRHRVDLVCLAGFMRLLTAEFCRAFPLNALNIHPSLLPAFPGLNAQKQATLDHPIHELIAKRWSPYAFADRAVSDDDLRSLFEAARWAASSYNEQPWSYIVATKAQPEEFGRLLSCLVEGNQPWAKAAPVLMISVVKRTFDHGGKPNRCAFPT